MNVGFIGTGTMGLPMAGRLLDAGFPLVVWNRTSARGESLRARGAILAESVDALFERCAVILIMLLDERAADAVLQPGTPPFARRVRGRTIVMLGTTSPAYSQALEAQVHACGGRYVEAPVSGSRDPAASGSLVGMTAGDVEAVRFVEPLLATLCRQVFSCGAVPGALRMKLAVNHYLVVLVAALAEAVRSAEACGIDLGTFRDVLDAGPMASPVSRAKLDKLLQRDFSPQAAIHDVAAIAALVRDQARAGGVDVPLAETTARLFAEARERGLAGLDMAAVFQPAPPPSDDP